MENRKEERCGRPSYGQLKERMKTDFKQIRKAVKRDRSIDAELIRSFCSDAWLMTTYPGKGDEYYAAFRERVECLSEVFNFGRLCYNRLRFLAWGVPMSRELRSGKWLGLFLLLAFGCSGCVPFALTPASTPAAEATAAPTLTPTAEATATPLPVPSSTPSSVAVVHDAETRTGIENIDHIIDVVLEGDVDRVQDVLIFKTVGCTHEDGLGGPPKCREGESEGTEVEVLPFLGPEGHFLRRDEVHQWPGIEVTGLYGVYRVSENAYSEEYYPAGQFGIIFVGAREGYSVVLQVDNGGVVRIDYVFGDSPGMKLEREAEEIVLPPP